MYFKVGKPHVFLSQFVHFMVVFTLCFQLQHISSQIFRLAHLYICYVLVTCFSPYFDHHQATVQLLKYTCKSVHTTKIHFIYDTLQLHVNHYSYHSY